MANILDNLVKKQGDTTKSAAWYKEAISSVATPPLKTPTCGSNTKAPSNPSSFIVFNGA